MITFEGTCPVCTASDGFESADGWFRDHLLCKSCGSLPRERAFHWALERFCPDWRTKQIHESSPADRPVSDRLARECRGYIGSHYYDDVPRGQTKDFFQSEDLQALTFADQSLDLHVHLDVMEHVNRPDKCLHEMARTLKIGGMAIFTTPIYQERTSTQRRAIYFEDGVEHLAEPEYHGNPISGEGALVTFHFGQDISDLMRAWEPRLSVLRMLPDDPTIGVVGSFRDVFVLTRIS